MPHLVHVNCWQCNRRLTSASAERYVTFRIDPKTGEDILVCSERCAKHARHDPRWDPPESATWNWRLTAARRAHWFGPRRDSNTSACGAIKEHRDGPCRPTSTPQNFMPCRNCVRLALKEAKRCHPEEESSSEPG